MSGEVRFESHDAMAVVTLLHPGKFNAMSRAMWDQLRLGFERLALDAALRCVVLRGDGGNFCAGGDIGEYPEFRFDPGALRDFHEARVWGALQGVLDCAVPVLAQIDGNCMGAGVEIASCCDIRIAGESARFGAPIARLGFPMAPREMDLVLREVGATAARDMLFEARVLDAERMRELGFLSRVVPDAELGREVLAAQRHVRTLAPQAARMNKQTMRSLQSTSRGGPRAANGADPLQALAASAYDYARSPEHREGVAAFIAKRRPCF